VGDRLTFLGHSTVLVDIDGVRVLTDPLLGHLALAIRRQVPAVPPETLVDLSAVFISHGHLDHLDLESLRALPGEPAFIVPVGLGRVVAKVARGAVHEMRAGDRLSIGDLTLEAVHAEHDRRRSPFTSAEGALGILIAGSTSIYFAGDTGLFAGMRQLAGRVDVALLPVSGLGPHARQRPSRPAASCRGGGTNLSRDRRAHPLGHALSAGFAARRESPVRRIG